VAEVDTFLAERIDACLAAGIPRQQLLIDPGFGFGKTLDHNLSLFGALDAFLKHQLPLLVGVSRKSMFGQLLQLPVERRMHAGVAAATLAVAAGAAVIRTHDVQATVDAVRFAAAIRQLKQSAEVHEEMNPRPAVRFALPLKN